MKTTPIKCIYRHPVCRQKRLQGDYTPTKHTHTHQIYRQKKLHRNYTYKTNPQPSTTDRRDCRETTPTKHTHTHQIYRQKKLHRNYTYKRIHSHLLTDRRDYRETANTICTLYRQDRLYFIHTFTLHGEAASFIDNNGITMTVKQT